MNVVNAMSTADRRIEEMHISSWKHAVVVTREEVLRRYFTDRKISKLNSKETLDNYSHMSYYERRYHDVIGKDQGYIMFYDTAKER